MRPLVDASFLPVEPLGRVLLALLALPLALFAVLCFGLILY